MIVMVIVMKLNFLIPIVLSIVLGFLCGKIIFNQYEKSEVTFNEEREVYFLQQGVYSTLESKNANISNLKQSVTVIENDKYYVYVGITKNVNNAEKIEKIYKDKGITLYRKQLNISNEEFLNNLEQYDLLLKNANKEEEVLSIMKVILGSYEETVLAKEG